VLFRRFLYGVSYRNYGQAAQHDRRQLNFPPNDN
jgi:hypothetical protein